MTSVLVAQIGARRHYAVPRALQAQGVLQMLATDATAELAPWRWAPRHMVSFLPDSLRRLLARSVNGVPRNRIAGNVGYLLAGWFGLDRQPTPTASWAKRNARFARSVARRIGPDVDTVYAFNAAALEIFQVAHARGIRCVLDQTAAPWRWNSAMLSEENARWPGWESVPAEIDQGGLLAAREEAEWELTDLIVCGSSFAAGAVADSGGPGQKCRVVPYPEQPGFTVARTGGSQQGPIRVLYLGSLQLRKGIQYLFQAKQALGDAIEVRAVGSPLLSEMAMAKLASCMDVRGARPRTEVASHLGWADVLVLPTLSEGSANVCCEALAAGVPVLTTPNAGSVVRDGIDGWIVAPRDVQGLQLCLADTSSIRRMRRELQANSAPRKPRDLTDYGREICHAIAEVRARENGSTPASGQPENL